MFNFYEYDNDGAASHSIEITDCQFTGNQAELGACIAAETDGIGTDLTITTDKCVFSGNTATDMGGVLLLYNWFAAELSATFTNCLFSGNIGNSYGSYCALWCEGSSSTLATNQMNCTFAGNNAENSYGIFDLWVDNSGTINNSVTNSIIWGNNSVITFWDDGGTMTSTYYNSIVQGSNGSGGSWDTDLGTDGGNNIDSNPWYHVPIDYSTAPSTAGDFRNHWASLGIDAGTSTGAPSDDLNGNSRSGNPDMGAYEYGNLPGDWTGATSAVWETASNWSTGAAPSSSDNVYISSKASNQPVISNDPASPATCNDLHILTDASISINTGKALTIEGDLSVEAGSKAGGSFTISSDENGTGSLITKGSISGDVAMERYITESAWHLISIPTTGITANTFLGDYLQSWDETTGLWSDITDPETVLNTKQGYALWGTPSKATTYTFTGTPLTGNQEKGFTYTEVANKSYDGANIMGNPYPSALDWNLVIAGQTGLNNAVYCYNSSTGNYVSYVDGVGDCRYIPAMQGFVVMAATSGTLTLNNNYRVHNDASYYKSTTEKDQFVQLGVSGERFSDKAYMCFNNEATTGFDGQYDAYKLFSSEEASPQLYSFAEESILSINQLPECETIQLGFRCATSGIFTITLSEIADIPEAWLEDTKTGIIHNLQQGDYEFSWNPDIDIETRFKLHFKAVGINEYSSQSNILIYAADKQIFIKGVEKGEVIVSDIMGRVILQDELSGDGSIRLPGNLQTGIYLVTFQNGKEIITEKIFIK